MHPIRGDEMRALRKLRRDYPREAYVFVSERGGPISPIGFHRLIQRLGEAAKMPFPNPPAHASPRLRVQARQRWPRHPGPAALSRPQEHSAHRPIHRNGARPIQGFLEELTMAGRIHRAALKILPSKKTTRHIVEVTHPLALASCAECAPSGRLPCRPPASLCSWVWENRAAGRAVPLRI